MQWYSLAFNIHCNSPCKKYPKIHTVSCLIRLLLLEVCNKMPSRHRPRVIPSAYAVLRGKVKLSRVEQRHAWPHPTVLLLPSGKISKNITVGLSLVTSQKSKLSSYWMDSGYDMTQKRHPITYVFVMTSDTSETSFSWVKRLRPCPFPTCSKRRFKGLSNVILIVPELLKQLDMKGMVFWASCAHGASNWYRLLVD